MDLLDRLAALGVPADAAGPDGVLDTTVTVYNVDQLRDLLDPGFDDAGRRDHFDALFAGVGPEGGEGDAESRLVDRVAAHVFGAEELSDDDREAITPAFPLSVKVLGSPGPMTVSAPKDISTADGRLSIVDVTDLTITQGGYFICRSTPLQFKCQTLTRTGDTGSNAGDFNILGTVGATPPTPPQPPTPTQAPKGKDGECSSSGIAGTGGQPGTPGEPGTPGTHRRARQSRPAEPAGHDHHLVEAHGRPDHDRQPVRTGRQGRRRRAGRPGPAGRQRRQRGDLRVHGQRRRARQQRR